MNTLPEELYGLAAYLEGIETTASALNVSEDLLTRALHYMPGTHETLSRSEQIDIDVAVRDYVQGTGVASGEVVDYLTEFDGGEPARNLFFNLSESQADFILDSLGNGAAHFADMIAAFEADNYNISDLENSEFWSWFRELYEE